MAIPERPVIIEPSSNFNGGLSALASNQNTGSANLERIARFEVTWVGLLPIDQ
jgi:hypothetical protein